MTVTSSNICCLTGSNNLLSPGTLTINMDVTFFCRDSIVNAIHSATLNMVTETPGS